MGGCGTKPGKPGGRNRRHRSLHPQETFRSPRNAAAGWRAFRGFPSLSAPPRIFFTPKVPTACARPISGEAVASRRLRLFQTRPNGSLDQNLLHGASAANRECGSRKACLDAIMTLPQSRHPALASGKNADAKEPQPVEPLDVGKLFLGYPRCFRKLILGPRYVFNGVSRLRHRIRKTALKDPRTNYPTSSYYRTPAAGVKLKERRIKTLPAADPVDGRKKDQLVYVIVANVSLDPTHRAGQRDANREVALILAREHDSWRLARAPRKMRACIKQRVSGDSEVVPEPRNTPSPG